MNMFRHEELYRSEALLRRLRTTPITVCGAGTLGANLVESLARSGYGQLRVIDFDRVEEQNLSGQPYSRDEFGAKKATALAHLVYRAVGTKIDARAVRLDERGAKKLLKGSALVVDCFDNSVSRGLVKTKCEELDLACLHIGLAAEYAEIVWNEGYRVPSAAGDDVCDYPLARNLATLAVAVGAEVITRFVDSAVREGYSITLGDFAIRRLPH